MASIVTFYFSPTALFENSRLAKAVSECSSLEQANRALNALNIRTELDLEIDMFNSKGV